MERSLNHREGWPGGQSIFAAVLDWSSYLSGWPSEPHCLSDSQLLAWLFPENPVLALEDTSSCGSTCKFWQRGTPRALQCLRLWNHRPLFLTCPHFILSPKPHFQHNSSCLGRQRIPFKPAWVPRPTQRAFSLHVNMQKRIAIYLGMWGDFSNEKEKTRQRHGRKQKAI